MADYRNTAAQAARRHGLDVQTFLRQIQQESGFNPNAKSPAGARGIAQIMPGTARAWGVNPDDPHAALDAAARAMAGYVKKYGSYTKALQAYNAGEGAVDSGQADHYAETQNYVKSILGGKAPAVSSKRSPVARASASSSGGDVEGALIDSLLSGKHKDLLRAAIDAVDAGGGQSSPTGPTSSAPRASVGDGAKGVATFEGKKVSAWMVPELEYARAHGWKGTVTSGYRSDAEQTRIYNSGVRPAAKPRSLGGGGSNHSRTGPGQGAIDVSDAPTLARILKAKGSALQWAGAKDPVHFSVPRNGSY